MVLALPPQDKHAAAQVVGIAGSAISVGSESYNRGDPHQCYLLYRKTALSLLNSSKKTLSTSELLHPREKVQLLEALRQADMKIPDPVKATTLRIALDELIHARTSRVASLPIVVPKSKVVLHPSPSKKSRVEHGIQTVTPLWPSEHIAKPREDHSLFGWLPEDVLAYFFTFLSGRELCLASALSTTWRQMATSVAESRLRSWRKLPLGSSAIPSWTASVTAHEDLTARIGSRPSRPWWKEWTTMRVREMRLSGQHQFAQPERFGAGAELGIAALLRRYASGLEWMLHEGWPMLDAPACLLIPAYGSMAIANAVLEGDCPESRQLGASVWTIFDILIRRVDAIAPLPCIAYSFSPPAV